MNEHAMKKRIGWTCDYEGCNDFAQWYRRHKGKPFKFCSKHMAYLEKKRWGKRLSNLSKDDVGYFEREALRKESAKKKPFEVRLFPLEDGTWKVKIRDRRTGERRSFVLRARIGTLSLSL